MTSVVRAARARQVVAGTALACLTLLVGACGSASGSSASSVASTPVVLPSAGGSAPTGSSSSPAGVPAPAPATTLTAPPAYGATGGIFPCPTASVKVTLGISQSGEGMTLQVIDFTNTGSQFCDLGGYPGASLAGGTPLAQIGLAATASAYSSAAQVPLNPGQVASSLLQISHASNYSKATCDPVHAPYLVIAVPNTIGFVKLAYSATACAKPIEILAIHAITLGTGDD